MFSDFLRGLLRSVKASAKPFPVNFLVSSSFSFSCSFPFSWLFFSYVFLFQFQQFISKFLRNHLLELLNVILVHTQVKGVCHLNHSLSDFCNLLILRKSFEVMDDPLECLLPDAIYNSVTSS
uniref:Uncharacterized protein n=1 Tax=Rousettus aegyptiacus TaxID=9407 RepID=A0A7J8ILB4_ROUAE|nr:hypothetical protein HJG63_010591 [Rousettus aegyptiacus]